MKIRLKLYSAFNKFCIHLSNKNVCIIRRSINKYLIVFIVILFVEVFGSVIMKLYIESYEEWDSYLNQDSQYKTTFCTIITDILSFVILLNYIVPISLYVTIGKTFYLRNSFSSYVNIYSFSLFLSVYLIHLKMFSFSFRHYSAHVTAHLNNTFAKIACGINGEKNLCIRSLFRIAEVSRLVFLQLGLGHV